MIESSIGIMDEFSVDISETLSVGCINRKAHALELGQLPRSVECECHNLTQRWDAHNVLRVSFVVQAHRDGRREQKTSESAVHICLLYLYETKR